MSSVSGRSDVDSAFALFETIRRKAPEYLDLIAAQTSEEFDHAFEGLLERSLRGLEQNSKNFATLNEVGLTAALALALATPGLSITQEAHSNGHVDLTIVADHCTPVRRKLGEAKVWAGPEYHIKGLKQLLDRYSTGREERGLLIAYVKTRNIKELMQKLREVMNRDRPCDQTKDASDHPFRWSFLSLHAHSSGETAEVGHFGCNLFSDPQPEGSA
jgi:hypothetical protein